MDQIYDVLKTLNVSPLNIYLYGSRVYGTYQSNSDYDFIVISQNFKKEQYISEKININFYSPEKFQEKINIHEIDALECLFLDSKFILKQTVNFKFNLNIPFLRSSLMKTSSNSWVKCKKKLTIKEDYDPYTAKKSLFHSFRIPLFGIQIAKYGKIVDYTDGSDLFKEIMSEPNSWEQLKSKYQEIHNKTLSEFRVCAPK